MNDPKLNQLLQQWRELEPRGDFEANVQRRIRMAATMPADAGWLGWLRQPALATVAAVVIGLMTGTIGGIRSMSHPATDELQFLAPTTLAGAFLGLEAK